MKVELPGRRMEQKYSRRVHFPKEGGQWRANHRGRRKERRFICSVNGAKIHTTFDISKMQDTQGRDL